MAIICPFTIKCVACKYNRPDPDRNGEYSCFLKEDLEKQTKQEKKKGGK